MEKEILSLAVSSAPKFTTFNNKRSSQYFLNKSNFIHTNNCSYVSIQNKSPSVNHIHSDSFKSNNHNRSQSKTLYIMNNNHVTKIEIASTALSVKKDFHKIPSKELEDSFIEEDWQNGRDSLSLLDQDEIINEVLLTIRVYEKLIDSLNSEDKFIEDINNNMKLIEKRFDIILKIDIFNHFLHRFKSINNLSVIKEHLILEAIILGYVINLYVMNKRGYINLINIGRTAGNDFIETSVIEKIISSLNLSFESYISIIKIISKIDAENEESIYKRLMEHISKDSTSVTINKMMINKGKGIELKITDENMIESDISDLVGKNNFKEKTILHNITEYFYNQVKENENGISGNSHIESDLKNFEYIFFTLKHIDNKADLTKIKEDIYNDFFLNNLIDIKVSNEKITSENSFNNEINTEEVAVSFTKNELSPFLPPMSKELKYTLVLDLDETLVHYMEENDEAFVQVRPFTDFFLSEMSKYYEVVIFTAATEDYADIILKELDKTNLISHRLYRRHTSLQNEVFLKDISKLGRDLKKTLIIDNIKENFSLQPKNGLQIKSFTGDESDCELFALVKDLKGSLIN
jgi:Dullard-like phosphatase family protein